MGTSIIRSYKEKLTKEVSPASLGLFRILVGFVLMLQIASFISNDFVQKHIFDSAVRFKFYYFDFLEPLSPSGMKILMLLLLASSVLIMLGRFFKIAALCYGLGFTYLWLLDKGYFNNHYYFISLLVFLLACTNADAWSAWKGRTATRIPYYQVFVLKAQIFIVFFIAGINKVNYFWMVKFQPMKHILETKALKSGYDWLASDFFFAFFSWSGLLFDIAIGFLLWFPKTRRIGVILFICFNFLNYWIFRDIGEIGFFPFLLLACLTIFLDANNVEKKLSWLNRSVVETKDSLESKSRNNQIPVILISGFLIIQFVLPFRHLFYKDHVDWTGQGQRFAWRMKIMYKDVDMHFYVVEAGSNEKKEVNVGSFLNDKQYTNLMYYPDFIPPVAKYIKKEAIRMGAKNPKVMADFNVGFNGKPKQSLVNPQVDLSKVNYKPWKHPEWLNCLDD